MSTNLFIKILSVLLIAFSVQSFADEQIVDFSDKSIPILNEELRKSNKSLSVLSNDVSGIEDRVSVLENATVPTKDIGDWQSRTEAQVYQAATDGFFVGILDCTPNGADWGCYIKGYIGSTNNPVTLAGSASCMQARVNLGGSATTNSFMIPVKAGTYYKGVFANQLGAITKTVTYYWIPLGT